VERYLDLKILYEFIQIDFQQFLIGIRAKKRRRRCVCPRGLCRYGMRTQTCATRHNQPIFGGEERDSVPPGTLLAGVGRLQPHGGSDAV